MFAILVFIGAVIFFVKNYNRQRREGTPFDDIRIFDTEYSKEPTIELKEDNIID